MFQIYDTEILNDALLTSSNIMVFVGIITLIAVTIIPAPYGRFAPNNTSWGILIPSTLGWVIMESPNLWISAISLSYSNFQLLSLSNKILLILFLGHYIHRSIIYPFQMQGIHNRMPLAVFICALTFCSWNAINQSVSLLLLPPTTAINIRFLIGISVFVLGMYINIRSDYILLSLRKANEGYKIPYGFLYEYISCPNFAGEIIEWIGFAIACNSYPSWAFAFYTFCSLFPRALKSHIWYLNKFEDYPKSRKAIIPKIL